MEREEFDLAPSHLHLHIKCPSCLKLFKVAAKSIRQKRPRFQCSSCETPFWVPYPECLSFQEYIGHRFEEVVAPSIHVDLMECPKCGQTTPATESECKECGVIIEKYLEQRDDPAWYSAPGSLKQAWVRVLDDYENHEEHRAFIKQCLEHHNMEFAISRYGKLLDANSSDEIARKYMDEIVIRSTINFEKVPQDIKEKKFRLPFFQIIMFLCGACIALGFVNPMWRNLVGIGTSILFLCIAFRWYLR